MGNTNKKPQDYEVVNSFRPEQWVNKQKRGGFQIWENIQQNIRADVYPLTTQLKSSDLEHYEMRNKNNPDIVQVHNLRIDKQPSLCSKSADAHVFVERIPYRLSEINDLTQVQALSVLRASYSGFNTISTFYGPVEPYEDLICFNEQGRPKVWINANLAENKVQKQRQQNPLKNLPSYNEAYVNKIFDMVENRTIGKSFPENFKNSFRRSSPKSYFQAQNIIQELASEFGTQISPTIRPRNYENQQHFQYTSSQVQNYNYGNGNFAHGIGHQSQPVLKSSSINSYHENPFVSSNVPAPIRQSRIISSRQQLRATIPGSSSSYYNFGQQAPCSVRNIPSGIFNTSSPTLRSANPGKPQIIFNNSSSSFTILPQISHNNSASQARIVQSPSKIALNQQGLRSSQPIIAQGTAVPIAPQIQTPSRGQSQPGARSVRSSQVQTIHESPAKSVPSHRILDRELGPRYNVAQANQFPAQASVTYRQANGQQVFPGQIRNNFQFAPPPSPPVFGSTQRVAYQQPISQQQHQEHIHQLQYNLHHFPQTHLQKPIINYQLFPHYHPQNAQTITNSAVPSQPTPPQAQAPVQTQVPQVQTQPQQPTQSQQQNPQPQVQSNSQQLSEHEHNYKQAVSGQQNQQQDQVQRHLQMLQSDKLLHNEEKVEYQSQQHISQNHDAVSNEINQPQIVEQTNNRLNLQKVQSQQIQNHNIKQIISEIQQHQISYNVREENQQNQPTVEEEEENLTSEQNNNENIQVQSKQSHIEHNHVQNNDEEQRKEDNHNQDNGSGYTYMHRNRQQYTQQYSSANKIPDNARYEDIQQYIRNKYKIYSAANEENYSYQYRPSTAHNHQINRYHEPEIDVNQMADYVENKYEQYSQQNVNMSNGGQNANFSFRPTVDQVQRSQHEVISSHQIQHNYERTENYTDKYKQQTHAEKTKNSQVKQKGSGSNKRQKEEGDMLDVGFMERSLDKKYSSLKNQQSIKNNQSDKKQQESGNQIQFDVKKLEENLIRFEESRVGSRQAKQEENVSEPRFETSQVSKINSIDYRLGHQRKSSTRRDFRDEVDSYATGRNYNTEYENQSPIYQYEKRNSARYSKFSKDIYNIEQKFNKYVANANKNPNPKGVLKQKQQNYGDQSGSRMATGHFGYTEFNKYDDSHHHDTIITSSKHYKNNCQYEEKKPFAVSEVTAHKNLTYDDLRKFLWS